ncbi:Inner membrane protein YidH [Starkeya nomas]|uniref:Inner membrane protein YidH n=1 Tax=Starkeya nomas TaxID=2666134 RepID=A0A5S9NI21_9HYPH|nr:DUF202 domain-containing protein [Starkeya nomas]CAA0090220.1 Inner membrane protein YidH [Starkeya nomas]
MDAEREGARATREALDHEPDYRFTLANERTYLAWVRTALGLLAGSVAIVQLVPGFAVLDARKLLGCLLALISMTIMIYCSWRWRVVQQAMRRDEDLPPTAAVWLLTTAILMISAIVLGLIVAYGVGR